MNLSLSLRNEEYSDVREGSVKVGGCNYIDNSESPLLVFKMCGSFLAEWALVEHWTHNLKMSNKKIKKIIKL
jgi:hypothetical protein